MKKMFYLLTMLLITATMVMAQPQRARNNVYSPETKAMMRVDQVASKVTLTDKEKAELLNLFTKQEKQRCEIKAKQDTNTQACKDECKAMREKNEQELKAVIGEKRYNEYKAALKADRSAKKGAKPAPGNKPEPPKH